MHHVIVEPLAIGMLTGNLILDLFVAYNPSLCRINQQHAARFETPLISDVFRRNAQNARLRSQDDGVVFGHIVTGRAKAVAIEDAPNDYAVGKADRSGTVPGFH